MAFLSLGRFDLAVYLCIVSFVNIGNEGFVLAFLS